MKPILFILLLACLLSYGAICNALNSDDDLALIIAKEQNNEVVLEKMIIEANQMKVISDKSVITIILPVSEGTSGSIIKSTERNGFIIARNIDGRLEIKFRSADGKEREYPPPALPDELKSFRIRVNVTSGDGYKQAFVIDNYDAIRKDDGPVIDMFGGMIPLEKGDYSITVETKKNIPSKTMKGTVPFEKINGWIVADCLLPNGKSGKFIFDTGASGGLVLKKSVLPENTEIKELKSVAYSSEGIIEDKGQMQSATGTVVDSNFLGTAVLSSFRMGDILLENLNVNVLKEFPDFLEKNDICGIAGINILSRAEIFRIEDIDSERGIVRFMNRSDKPEVAFQYQFNLQSAKNLFFLKGTIQGAAVDFLIDIGSRKTLTGKNLITGNNISHTVINEKSTITGIDGIKTEAFESEVSGISFQGETFDKLPFLICEDLSVTKMMGLEKNGAVLGMNFFSKFKIMEIDFVNNKLSLNL